MENEVMITVLNEVLEEQKLANQKIDELVLIVSSLNEMNRKLVSNFEAFENKPAQVDLRSTEILISRSADEIKRLIEEQPKEIKQEKRYLFFPESNVTEYYDVCMKWLLRIVVASYLFFLLHYLIERLTGH
ncbi:hypothetical protein [Pinibacter soli]|uniref:Uncharacterized protein n=1 Tax=Pinibacter soli TaxID=3044211 RepID=A0ABT6RFJ3_9BACT|nr:hypothetical protein [Pinibacter soli]MDI3321310.1 hypothetical protein [Pinibacter soli]